MAVLPGMFRQFVVESAAIVRLLTPVLPTPVQGVIGHRALTPISTLTH